MVDIDNNQDIIDSRHIVERLEELENDDDFDTFGHDLHKELTTLRNLIKQIDDNAGDHATDGVTLIRDSHFEDYAQEIADDLGMLKTPVTWPHSHIDWEAAAEELKQDYTEIDYDGVTYLLR